MHEFRAMRADDDAPPRVAFQGESGAFSEEAVLALFGPAAEPLPCREFRQVGEAVVADDADFGLLPIENSLAGSVAPSYDVLLALDLEVVAEITRPIRPCLLGLPGATMDGVRRVLSHPVALAQCSRFLSRHPSLEVLAVHDTAGAARQVAEAGDPARAAIAARAAAERYGLVVLAADIQDRSDNQTRFVAVARRGAAAAPLGGGPPKTMLLAETENRPGALFALLRPLAEHGLNLSKIESRPGPAPWTYRFFLELAGDARDRHVAAALEAVRREAVSLRVLGSFSAAADPPDAR